MTTSITRKFTFDSAHRVLLHESKCRHLHGHTYIANVTLELSPGSSLDALGRVVDFGVVKTLIGGLIDRELDHGTLVNANDVELVFWLQAHNQKHYLMDGNPTAENIARMLFEKISLLLSAPDTPFRVRAVDLWETPNCKATYSRD